MVIPLNGSARCCGELNIHAVGLYVEQVVSDSSSLGDPDKPRKLIAKIRQRGRLVYTGSH